MRLLAVLAFLTLVGLAVYTFAQQNGDTKGVPLRPSVTPRNVILVAAEKRQLPQGWSVAPTLQAALEKAGSGTIVVVSDNMVRRSAAPFLRELLLRGAVVVVYGVHSLEALSKVSRDMRLTMSIPSASASSGEKVVAVAVYATLRGNGALTPYYYVFWARRLEERPLSQVVSMVADWYRRLGAAAPTWRHMPRPMDTDIFDGLYTFVLSGSISDDFNIYCYMQGSTSYIDAAVGGTDAEIYVGYAEIKDTGHPGLMYWRVAVSRDKVYTYDYARGDFALPGSLLGFWIGSPEKLLIKTDSYLQDEKLIDYWVNGQVVGPKNIVVHFVEAADAAGLTPGPLKVLTLLVSNNMYAESSVVGESYSSYWGAIVQKSVEWKWGQNLPSLFFAREGEADAMAYFAALEPFITTVNFTGSLRYVGLDPRLLGKSCTSWRSYEIEAYTDHLEYSRRSG